MVPMVSWGVAPVVKPLPPELMRTVQENPVKALWVGLSEQWR